MKSLLPLIFATPLLAQELPFQRVERVWPNTFTGVSTSLVAGRIVPDHVGRSAVLMRGSQAYVSFQPLSFDHFSQVATPAALAPTPLASARQLATLPNHDGATTDRIAAVVAGGVDVWHYDGTAFQSVGGVQAVFAGATEIRAGVHQTAGGPENHFVAFTDTWVQGGVHMADDTVVPGPRIPVPANTTVWDVATVDWVAGGMPEIAVLSSAGFFVLDFLGNPLASQAFPVTGRGAVCTIDQAGTPGLTAVIPTGSGQWLARTWQAGSATTWDSPTFALPGIPNGIASAQLTDDSYSDVLVSCSDNLERVMVGTVDGPTWQNGYYIRKADPSGTADRTASVLDDIDRDGEPDLLVQSDGGNQLVLVGSVPEQMATFSNMAYSKAPVARLDQPEIRGVVLEHRDLNGFSNFPSNSDALVVRFDLPAGLSDHMQIRCYQYAMQGDMVDTSSVATYFANIPAGASNRTFDMLVPVPPMVTGVIMSRMLEFTLVDTSDDTFESPSVFGRYSRHPGEVLPAVIIANMMDPASSVWLIKTFENFIENWGSLISVGLETIELQPNQNSGNSSRYIGDYEPTEELSGQQTGPDGAPPQNIPGILL